MFNPCPCTDLQSGVQILAGINMAMSIVLLVLYNLIVADVAKEQFETDGSDLTDEQKSTSILIARVFGSILFLFVFAFAASLFSGASNRNYDRCKCWLIVTVFVFFIGIWKTASAVNNVERIMEALGDLFTVYQMLVVYAFMDEIKMQQMLGMPPGGGLPFMVNSVGPAPYPMAGQPNPGANYSQTGYPGQGAPSQHPSANNMQQQQQ